MPPSQAFAVAFLVVTLAGVVRGFSGFGSGLVMSPALSLLFGPPAAVAGISLIDLPALLYLLPEAWRHGQWRSVIPLGVAGATTVPVGAWMLVYMNQDVMRHLIGVIVLAFVLVLGFGWRYRGKAGLPLTLGAGAASGFLGGSMGIAGPPIILFYMSGPEGARTARASIMGFFAFTSAISMTVYAWLGLYTETVLWRTVGLVPAYFVGVWIGSRLFGRVSDLEFRKVVLVLLTVIALAALLR